MRDFVVLGQLSAKIIYYAQNALVKLKGRYQMDFIQECSSITFIYFLVILLDIASELEKIGSNFTSFNVPFPSLTSVATNDTNQFQFCKIVFNV